MAVAPVAAPVYSSAAHLAQFSGPFTNQRYADVDGIGRFKWYPNDTTTADNLTVIAPSGGATGRWKLVNAFPGAQTLIRVDMLATSNLTLSGLQDIDGQTGAAGKVVLPTAQTDGAQNVPWVMAADTWTRPTWYDADSDALVGQFATVLSGDTYGGTLWLMSSPTSGTIDLGTTDVEWTQFVTGEQDLAPTYAAVANHPAATGVRTGAARSHASSIDAAITDLDYHACWDNGRAAAVGTYGMLPIVVFLHGYNGTWGNITDNPKFRACDAGFYAITPNLRGRTGSGGTADDSARELQDIDDAITHAIATNPTLIDGSRIVIIGYSGGGANAVAYAAKRPGKCVAVIAMFGWGDYGVSPSSAHSFWGFSVGDRATIESRIGTRNGLDLGPYRARNALTNIAQSLNLADTKLYLFWDEEDADVGTLFRDVEQALVDGGVPRSLWYAEESGPGDAIRWEHGYVDDVPALVNAEYVAYSHRDDPAPTVAEFGGPYTVCGHVRHPQFEVWTAATGTVNPRTASTGGQRYRVNLWFNTRTQEYEVEPLDGACRVLVKLADGTEISKEVS